MDLEGVDIKKDALPKGVTTKGLDCIFDLMVSFSLFLVVRYFSQYSCDIGVMLGDNMLISSIIPK